LADTAGEIDGGGIGVETFCRSKTISATSFYRWRSLLDNVSDRGKVVGSRPSTG